MQNYVVSQSIKNVTIYCGNAGCGLRFAYSGMQKSKIVTFGVKTIDMFLLIGFAVTVNGELYN